MADRADAREPPQIATRTIIIVMALILSALIAVAFGLQLIFVNRIGQTHTTQTAFPEPAVIPNERAERLALEARQRHELAGANGRMPIAAAMRAIAAKGTHAFDPVGCKP
jgi:hypothetical protein